MIQVLINSVDLTSYIQRDSLQVQQNLTNQVDTASFVVKKYGSRSFTLDYNDDVKIFDGATQIFGGIIQTITETTEGAGGVINYQIDCSDYTIVMDKRLVAETYESMTVKDIIDDILANYTTGFTAVGITCSFLITNITFNQMLPSDCLKKLAEIVMNDWYVDENKGVHFFAKNSVSAPFNLTDTSGNYVFQTLQRVLDGTQITNRVKVRGGEYNGNVYSDSITVKGSNSKSFTLPYQFANLVILKNTVPQVLGIDNIDDFATHDVLYNFEQKNIRWNANLNDGDIIAFSGNPKTRVFAVAEDSVSIASYGKIEKLIRDDNITSNGVARQRASAELYAYSNKIIDATFETRTSGLRVGMSINISSTTRNSDDDLTIKTLTFHPLDANNFGYTAECVSTKRQGLIELLQMILRPAPLSADASEVTEDIFSDTQSVSIVEDIGTILPVSDEASVAIAELVETDPLGAGVEPTWVLARYRVRWNFNFYMFQQVPRADNYNLFTLNSARQKALAVADIFQTNEYHDPQREGRLDYSLKVY
jgi:hypothetical protein